MRQLREYQRVFVEEAMFDWARLAENFGSMILGGLFTYFAPWIAWPIEKRRETRTHKRELIKEWRQDLLDVRKYFDSSTGGNIDDLDDQVVADKILGKPSYASLEPHLSDATRERIRELANPILVVGRASRRSPGPPPGLLRELSNEIARIERDWEMV